MTDSIRGMGSCPAAPATTDDHLRAATGAGREASAAHHAEEHDPSHAIHRGADTAAFVLETAGAAAHHGTALAFALELGGALTSAAAMWAGYATSVEDGHRRNVEYDSEMMRGCLYAFEGRADEPDVRAYAAASPAFANGIRDAERIAVRDPELFACIRASVVASNAAGAEAVYRGTDASPEAATRYETDLAFRHGVEHARALREADPAAFERSRAAASAMHTSIDDGRRGPVRA